MKNWLKKPGGQIQSFVKSIRFRLTVWYLVILALILVAFSLFVYYRQAQLLVTDTRTELQESTQQLMLVYHSFSVSGDSQPPTISLQGSEQLAKYINLALIGTDGSTLQKVGSISSDTINQLLQAWQASSQTPDTMVFNYSSGGIPGLNFEKQTLYLVTPILVERHWIGLLILSSPVDPSGQLPRLLLTLALASLGTLAIALAGGYWLAARAMAPVRTITHAARGISETDLHKRINLNTQDELGELAGTFDAMLARLEAAFNRQRQFTADASHELRTPLTIVGLESDQALAHHRTVDEYERTLKIIKSENGYMSRLVGDLLTLARMDAGQTQMNFVAMDLSELVLDVVERLSSLAVQAGVELHMGDFPEVKVRGDEQYLTQLMTNLIENAIKYAGGRGHHVNVETGQKTINGRLIGWVQVEDNGPGIPAEHLPHLFDRFYRVDKARTRRQDDLLEVSPEKAPEGSGLGLSIAQWIAQAHGGQVVVQSQVGQGSTFEVQLPWFDGSKV